MALVVHTQLHGERTHRGACCWLLAASWTTDASLARNYLRVFITYQSQICCIWARCIEIPRARAERRDVLPLSIYISRKACVLTPC
jgi:hypothetical protein